MLHLIHRSLLAQLLSVYLLFVIIVLLGGAGVNVLTEQHLRDDAQASNQALAQTIALETGIQLRDTQHALTALGTLAEHAPTLTAIKSIFSTFRAARGDVDQVYWLDPFGGVLVSSPPIGTVAEFSPPDIVQRARVTNGPIFEVGIVGISAQASIEPGLIIAQPVRTASGKLVGMIAANISLVELSAPVSTVVLAQQHQQRQLMISIIDNQGVLIATPDHRRILQTVLDELPGADQALQGHTVSRIGPDNHGQDWLFSSVPIPDVNWAVVVQKPTSEALAVVAQFQFWLLIAAFLFTLCGILFWLTLLNRVIRPLHILAIQHQALPTSEQSIPVHVTVLASRDDEVGDLARSLVRLERDGLEKLRELRTLLETSNEVVRSLEPHAVVRKIIGEARRLVDMQAAAVLIPDEQAILHVLVSDGHSERYDQLLAITPEYVDSTPVQALRSGKPVQKLLTSGQPFPSFSYDDGFRTALAIPIISRHAGSVVLLVHRTEPHLFEQAEINLLLTFANYATLAWEHAILYERSDERLREIAQENEHLYQQAAQEKQILETIMSSMEDGLVLTGIDGMVLYANQGTSTIAGLPGKALEHSPISTLYDALHEIAIDVEQYERQRRSIASSEASELTVAIQRNHRRSVIRLRLFDVGNERSGIIGRGLLLRDVTREHELDEFKSTLLAAVGHEVRTPLSAIKGYASTLLQEDVTWSLADQRHFLQTISSEADRLALLVSNLLDLSRQEAGLLLITCAPARLQDLLQTTLALLHHSQTRISLHIPDDLPLVHVDCARIEVVLYNLVTNALIYSEDNVSISASKQDKAVVVAIANPGSGIDPEDMPHIFERFYRARHDRQQHSHGTGLGLTISKAFVEAHGCTIWVESNAQNTIISFTLPLF